MNSEKKDTYKGIKILDAWINAMFILYITFQGITLFFIIRFCGDIRSTIALLEEMSENHYPHSENLDYLNRLENGFAPLNLLYIVTIFLFIVSAVLVGIWIYRSHKNAWALNIEGIKYRPEWAIGSFFIPVVHFFVPYQAIKSMVTGSLKLAGKKSMNLAYWWGAWIFGIILGKISEKWLLQIEPQLPEEPTMEQISMFLSEFLMPFYLEIISSVLMITSAFLLLKIINATTQAHQQIAKNAANLNQSTQDEIVQSEGK